MRNPLYELFGIYDASEPPEWFPIIANNDILTVLIWFGVIVPAILLCLALLVGAIISL